MDPSYNNSFGNFESGGVVFAQPEKKSRRGLVVVAVILVVLILVLGGVLWFMMSNNGRDKIMEEVDELDSSLGWVSYTEQCSLVESNVEDIYATESEYEGYIDACRNRAKRVKEIMSELKGIDSSSEYVSLYNSLNSFINERMVFGEDLDNILKDFKAWHSFFLASSDAGYYQLFDETDEMVLPLIETGNEKLIKFAEEWAEKKKELNLAYMMAEDSDEESYKQDFEEKLAQFELFEQENSWNNLFKGFDTENDNVDFWNAIYEFKSYVKEEM